MKVIKINEIKINEELNQEVEIEVLYLDEIFYNII